MTIARPLARRFLAPIALAALATSACGGGADFMAVAHRRGDANGVSAVALPDRIVVTNRTATPVFVFVVGQRTLIAVDWIPCADPAICPPIGPGASRDYMRAQIAGGNDPEIGVYWWHGVISPDGPRPDSIRSFVIGTR